MSELTDRARAAVESVADGEWAVETVYEGGVPRGYRVSDAERWRGERNPVHTGEDKALAEFIAGSRELILALARRVDELETGSSCGESEAPVAVAATGTVAHLISELREYPQNALVVMSADAEGNRYSPWYVAAESLYAAETTWRGDVYPTAEQVADFEDPDAYDYAPEDAVPCVVLWPTN